MPLTEYTTYQVCCDVPGCGEESTSSESESGAKSYAKLDGFFYKAFENEWLCPKHVLEDATKPKKKGARR